MHPRSPVAIASVTLTLALLAGCGSSGGPATIDGTDNGEAGKTGAQVAKDATEALVGAGAVHIEGTFETQDPDSKPLAASLVMQSQADGGTLSAKAGTYTTEAVSVGGKSYVKLDASTSRVFGGAGNKYVGSWLATNDDDDKDTTDLTLASVASQLTGVKDFGTIDPTVSTTSLDGERAVLVTSDRGSKLWVSATGKPYPLRIDLRPKPGPSAVPGSDTTATSATDGPGTLTFSRFGDRVPLATPSPIVDSSTLLPSVPSAPSASVATPFPIPS